MAFSNESKMKFPIFSFFKKKRHKLHLLFDLSTKEEY